MPDFGDISGLPPVTLDPTSDLASLAWPWDEPLAAPDVPAAIPAAPGGESPLAAPPETVPPLAAAAPLPATQPGLGIPRAVLDAIVPAAPPASPIPAAPGIAPPVVAAPAVEQPLTPTAGAAAPPFDPTLPPAPPVDAAGFAPAPLGESGLPPAPSPLAPAVDQGLLPDAITGRVERTYGTPSEPVFGGDAALRLTPEQRYAAVAGEYQRDPNKLLDRLEQPGALDADTQRYLDDFAARDPAGAAVVQQRLRDAGTMQAAAERARIAKDTLDKQMANLTRLNAARAEAAKKSAEIDAEATKIADTKVGYHPSTFQGIAGVIAAVVGGLYQGRTGSATNPGLVALNQVIDRDLEEQRLNLTNRRDVLAQRRSALGELTARNNDEYQANETMRLAALKYADEQLAQQQLNFAPDGTRGLNLAMLRTGLNAQIAANKEARDGVLLDRSLKVSKEAREADLNVSTIVKNRADIAKTYAEIDKLKADDGKGQPLTPAQWQEMHPDNPVPPIALNEKDYTAFLTARKTGNEIANQAPETTRGVPGVTVADPKTGAEKTFVATGEPSEVAKLRAKVAANKTIVHLLDSALSIRDGYSNNSVTDRKQWQQLQQIWGAASAKGKDALGLGVLSTDDYKLLNRYLGTDDPTSFRDPTAGIQQARRTILLDLNDSLHSAGYPENRHFDVVDTSKPTKPRDTVDDRALKMVLDDPEKVARSNFDPSLAPRPARNETDIFPEQHRAYRNQPLQPDYRGHGILLQRQQLDEWAKRAGDPSAPGHDDAWTRIADVAGREGGGRGAATAEVRAYAQQLLTSLIGADIDRIPTAGGR